MKGWNALRTPLSIKRGEGKVKRVISGREIELQILSDLFCEVNSIIGCTYDVHGHCLSYVCYHISILIKYFSRGESWIVTPLSIYIISLMCVLILSCKFRQ